MVYPARLVCLGYAGVVNTQQARDQYREHIGGFYKSGKNYGKPYLKSGWVWPRVRFLAAGPSFPKGYVDLPVHPAMVPAMQALAAVFYHHGYAFRETAGGTVNMRNITGAKASAIDEQVRRQYPLATSVHSITALDINPSKNPYGSGWDELEEGAYKHVPASIRRIKTVAGLTVFRLGMDWSNDDAMHFEPTGCTRAQLEAGINFDTVIGWASYLAWIGGPTTPQGGNEMFSQYGDGYTKAPADSAYAGQDRVHMKEVVIFSQNWLARSGWDGDIDGVYGPQTIAGVIEFGASKDGKVISGWVLDNIIARGMVATIDDRIKRLGSAPSALPPHDHDGRYLKSVTGNK